MNPSATEANPDSSKLRRLHEVLRADNQQLFGYLNDPDRDILKVLLKNPALNDEHLLVLLRRRDLTEDFLKGLARHPLLEKNHRLKVALVGNPAAPSPIVQSILPQLHLFELVNLCFIPGVTPDQRLAAERAIIQRLPNVPLGSKVTLARRTTSNVVAELLKEGQVQLMEACLNNPRLKEVSILQFINSARSQADTISAIARHPKWKNRPNLKQAILKNPRTPNIWFTLFLPNLTRSDLRNLAANKRLRPDQRRLVTEALGHRS